MAGIGIFTLLYLFQLCAITYGESDTCFGSNKLQCLNGGKCKSNCVGIKCMSSCECPPNFSGKFCEKKIEGSPSNDLTTCRRVCDPNCIQNGSVIQKFQLPKTAMTIVGDQNNVYITTSDKTLISYKKNSNWLISGSSYRDSINSTLTLSGSGVGLSYVTNGTLYVATESSTEYFAATNPLPYSPRAKTSLSMCQWGVFTDRFSFVWVCSCQGVGYLAVFDNNANLIGQIPLPAISGVDTQCSSLFIMNDDSLVFAAPHNKFFVFKITRDSWNRPMSLMFSGVYSTLYNPVTGMSTDKYNNLFMLEFGSAVYSMSYSFKGTKNYITLPDCSVGWSDIWIDPVTNFVFLVGQNQYIYVMQYI